MTYSRTRGAPPGCPPTRAAKTATGAGPRPGRFATSCTSGFWSRRKWRSQLSLRNTPPFGMHGLQELKLHGLQIPCLTYFDTLHPRHLPWYMNSPLGSQAKQALADYLPAA